LKYKIHRESHVLIYVKKSILKFGTFFLVLSYFFSNIFYTFAPSKRTDYYPELSKGKLVENQEYKGEVMLKKH